MLHAEQLARSALTFIAGFAEKGRGWLMLLFATDGYLEGEFTLIYRCSVFANGSDLKNHQAYVLQSPTNRALR